MAGALLRGGIIFALPRSTCSARRFGSQRATCSACRYFWIEQRLGRVGRPRTLVDADRPHRSGLEDAHELQPNHLEQRQERDDQPGARLDVGEEILEAARVGLGHPRHQFLDAVFDRNLLGRQVDLRPLFRPLDDSAKGGDEAEEIDFDFRLGRFAGDFGDRAIGPGPLRAAQRLALVQQLGRGLELLVFEQAPHQGLARILVGILLRRIGARQEHARLDVDERRRHDEELPRHVEVHLLHQVDVVEILPGDERDRNVVDVQLALLDEVQQQIEGPFEIVEPDRIGLEDGFEFSVFHVASAS